MSLQNNNSTDSHSGGIWAKLVLALLVMVGVFNFGVYTGRKVDPGTKVSLPLLDKSESRRIDHSLYWQVWDIMREKYVDADKVDMQDMLYGAIKGMVASYGDRATYFLTPEETQEYIKQTSGTYFSGIGAELGYNDEGQIQIVTPLKGSSALKAGVRPGDVILAVDDEPVKPSDTVYDLVAKIRGETGTVVKLKLLAPGSTQPREVEITRSPVTIPSIGELKTVEKDGKRYAVLEVSRFTEETYDAWKELWDAAVEAIALGKYDGLVLDLRGNPGGYLNAALYAGEDFLPRGSVLMYQMDRKGDKETMRVERPGRLPEIPVVVIVNEASASAAEILSGALQQNDRATIVGKATYGKGTAQEILPFQDGSTLHITKYKWLLPDGTWINHDNPITPDIEVDRSEEDFQHNVDPQMDKALEVVGG